MERGAGAGEEERPGEAPQKSRSEEEAEARTASRQLLPRGGACAGGGAGSVPPSTSVLVSVTDGGQGTSFPGGGDGAGLGGREGEAGLQEPEPGPERAAQ